MRWDVIGRRARRRLGGFLAAGLVLALVPAAGAGASAANRPCADRSTGGSEREALRGGPGADCLNGGAGKDSLTGGPGGDRLLGGPGDDQILPGAGTDRVRAGRGDDLVFARDGNAETVSCGPGRDAVSADAEDVVRGCEEVSLAAPRISWYQFYTHVNAYGYGTVGHSKDGYCKGDKNAATCKGTSEEGNFPFSAGKEIRMEWEPSAYGGSQIVTIRAPQTDSILFGRASAGWAGPGLQVTGAWIQQWIDPNDGVILTGTQGEPGTQGGPLRAFLSYHSFPDFPFTPPRASGYSLDLRGWVKFVFIN